MKDENGKILERVNATRAYMASRRGRANWIRNAEVLHMPESHNYVAAIQTATGLCAYEAIMQVYDALTSAGGMKETA